MDDVRINASGCLDRCELGPTVVLYPDSVWYTCKTIADAEEILISHVRDGHPVERLRLSDTRTPENDGASVDLSLHNP